VSLLLALGGGGPAPDEGQPWQFWQAQDVELQADDAWPLSALIEDDALWIAALPLEELEAEASEDWQQPYIEDDPPLAWAEVPEALELEDEAGFVATFIEEEAVEVEIPASWLEVELGEEGYELDARDVEAFPLGALPEEGGTTEWITRARRRTRR
jgi:hypothetical protein